MTYLISPYVNDCLSINYNTFGIYYIVLDFSISNGTDR